MMQASAPPARQNYPQQGPPLGHGYPQNAGYGPGAPAQGQPTPVGYPPQQQMAAFAHEPEERDWNDGLCDCCGDCGLCCDVMWCFWCTHSRVYSAAVDDLPNTFNCGICCLMFLCTHLAVGHFVNTAIAYVTRSNVRQKYRLRGSCCGDFLKTFCCMACATCQEHKQLSKMGMNPGHTCCSPSTNYIVQPHAPRAGYSNGA
ncbi:Cell number regulator 3 [Diplonema papillatum]|nr:Cell number regulator 3 [Diplonema papillatum]